MKVGTYAEDSSIVRLGKATKCIGTYKRVTSKSQQDFAEEVENFVHEVCHLSTLNIEFPDLDEQGMTGLDGFVGGAVKGLSCQEAMDWDEVKTLAVQCHIFETIGVEFNEEDLENSINKSVSVQPDHVPVIMEQVMFLKGSPEISKLSDRAFQICRRKLEDLGLTASTQDSSFTS